MVISGLKLLKRNMSDLAHISVIHSEFPVREFASPGEPRAILLRPLFAFPLVRINIHIVHVDSTRQIYC